MKFNSSLPIYLQVVNDIKKQIVLGKYKPGQKLPSSKELAVKYSINPNTAVRIYRELESQKICDIKRGLGTFVTESQDIISSVRKEMADKVINSFITEMTGLGYNFRQMRQFIMEREVQ